MIIKGTYTSLWEEGTVQTPATLDTETGEVTATAVSGDGLEHLMEETFTDNDGNDYDVCCNCHNHIMRTRMVPAAVGKTLVEVGLCSDPDCESNQE